MLFNSPEFLLFFALVYGLYLLLPFRPQNFMLLLASYVFYGWWDARFLFLVVLSTVVDFWVGLMLANGQLTAKQRLLPAVFLVLSAVLFLGFNFNDIGMHDSSIYTLIRIKSVFLALAGVCLYLVALFILYELFKRSKGPDRRLLYLMVSLVTQLCLLGIFKYFNFFADSLVSALNNIGIDTHQLHLNIVLPVGVSFYTFQSLSYTIDIYRKQFEPTGRFFDFALFVAFFPQLQAGPIERGRQLIPQLSRPRVVNIDQFSRGAYLIVLGFFKKVAIADGAAPIVDQIFASTGRVTFIDVVVGSVLFAVQIYCDFSGYTDVARGIAKLMGIELMVNFDQPYFATNPQDFWRRWHISLSTWLRDYLYVPLGGSRGNLLFICRNLMITMLLGGLWHGAAWNFVLWGFYQGTLLCIYRAWTEIRIKANPQQWLQPISIWRRKVLHVAANLVFFLFVCYGWLLFRAHSFSQIFQLSSLLVRDFGDLDYGGGTPRLSSLIGIPLLICLEIIQYGSGNGRYYRRFPPPLRGFLVAALLVITMMGMSNEPAQFIYFQF